MLLGNTQVLTSCQGKLFILGTWDWWDFNFDIQSEKKGMVFAFVNRSWEGCVQ